MAEERPIVEEVLDFAVYAPIGLALTVVEDLPELVARGRRQVAGQLGVARFVAKMATSQLRKRLDAYLATPRPAEREVASTTREEAPSAPRTTAERRPSSEHLAIDGYDSLAASQVVARLATLSADERHAVRAYEAATRRRQTILNRIEQLDRSES